MAYVAPSTRSTDELITAAIWNQDVVANPIAIKAQVDALAAPTGDDYEKVVSSSAETTMSSYTITADSMGTDGLFNLQIWGRGYNNTGGAKTGRLRVKLGATTIFDTGALTYSNGQYQLWDASVAVMNADSASSQVIVVTMKYWTGGALATLLSPTPYGYLQVAAEDTTGDLTLATTIELSAADANLWTETTTMLLGPLNP